MSRKLPSLAGLYVLPRGKGAGDDGTVRVEDVRDVATEAGGGEVSALQRFSGRKYRSSLMSDGGRPRRDVIL
jgi:hypothetical protein